MPNQDPELGDQENIKKVSCLKRNLYRLLRYTILVLVCTGITLMLVFYAKQGNTGEQLETIEHQKVRSYGRVIYRNHMI